MSRVSGQIRKEHIYTHLGWRKRGEKWVYLHSGGAIGTDGPASGVHVRLPAALHGYQVEQPQDSDDRANAVRDSLRFLNVAPDHITLPLFAGVYGAVFGDASFSLFLAGTSGIFKTELAALCQQHFGAEMAAARLPANFASTANALESFAFHSKDALLVIDDFAPTGMGGDHALHGVAERLFRAAGNQQGPNRMTNARQTGVSQPPRALVLATGEDVPKGQSIRARLLIVELGMGDVDRATLTDCQKAAQNGRFAVAMGSFLTWIAQQHDLLQQRLRLRVQVLRSQGRGRTVHARLPNAAAALQARFEIFLEFALEIGAITKLQSEELARRLMLALDELIARQAKYHHANDPTRQFLSLLQTAFACGGAHVSDRAGEAPDDPSAWGWKRNPSSQRWTVQGARVGWLAGSDLFLDPAISYQVAQQVAGNERLSVSEQMLRQRLRERHLLASVDVGRQMLTVRRTLEGRPRQVLHLKANDLLTRKSG